LCFSLCIHEQKHLFLFLPFSVYFVRSFGIGMGDALFRDLYRTQQNKFNNKNYFHTTQTYNSPATHSHYWSVFFLTISFQCSGVYVRKCFRLIIPFNLVRKSSWSKVCNAMLRESCWSQLLLTLHTRAHTHTHTSNAHMYTHTMHTHTHTPVNYQDTHKHPCMRRRPNSGTKHSHIHISETPTHTIQTQHK